MFTLPSHPRRRLMFVADTDETGAGAASPVDADAAAAKADAEATAKAESEKDWKAEFEAQQRINRGLERKGKSDLARITAFEAAAGAKPEGEAPDADRIRADVTAEIIGKTNARIVASEAKVALTGKVNISPAAALKLLDLSEVEVDADGNVDAEALSDLVAKLLSDEPHLAVAQGTRFQGSADQGPRGSVKSEEQALTAALAEAEKARNFVAAVGIKQRIAALAASKRP
ncbi:MAG: hypothetical protein ACOH10_13665 [Rhodoglobus sp.]